MTNGIYCYCDTKNNDKIVYVGKDSHIGKNKRFNAHMAPSNYNKQRFNRILQNNPDRYKYKVLREGNFEENLLNVLEIIYTRRYSPKFSYTIGGDGCTGYHHTEESKQKISEGNKGKLVSEETKRKISENNCRYWQDKHHSEKTKKKISQSISGEKHWNYGKTASLETRKKMSESQKGSKNYQWKDYARIVKSGKNRVGNQTYCVKYNGKCLKYSVNTTKLTMWFNKNYPNVELRTIGDDNPYETQKGKD